MYSQHLPKLQNECSFADHIKEIWGKNVQLFTAMCHGVT